jgi:hypothetical protein
MRESWAVYPSVTVPEAGDNLPAVPEEETFVGAVEREIKKMERSGPENSTVNGDSFWPHAMPHFWSNTLTGSRASLGVEHEPLPGASPAKQVLYQDDRGNPGEREG